MRSFLKNIWKNFWWVYLFAFFSNSLLTREDFSCRQVIEEDLSKYPTAFWWVHYFYFRKYNVVIADYFKTFWFPMLSIFQIWELFFMLLWKHNKVFYRKCRLKLMFYWFFKIPVLRCQSISVFLNFEMQHRAWICIKRFGLPTKSYTINSKYFEFAEWFNEVLSIWKIWSSNKIAQHKIHQLLKQVATWCFFWSVLKCRYLLTKFYL